MNNAKAVSIVSVHYNFGTKDLLLYIAEHIIMLKKLYILHIKGQE